MKKKYFTDKERKEAMKEYHKKYRSSTKVKKAQKKYDQKYYSTERGSAARRQASTRNHKKNRLLWNRIIKEKGMDRCSICGYDKCFAAIDFHHRDPLTKLYNIGTVLARFPTPERIAELDKTDALCRNCHAELEFCELKEKK